MPTQSAALTGAGSILGTLQYMAPEQLEGEEADARTDIFAFGTTVYEMVTGKKAFAGKSQASLIGAIMTSAPPPLTSLQPLSPETLDRVVTTCLAKDPEERWQSARDLQRELRWIGEAGPQVSPPTPPPAAPQSAGGQALPWVAGIVIGSLITGLAVWSLMRPAAPLVSRFTVSAPADPAGFADSISPDGRTIAFASNFLAGEDQVYVRRLDELEAVPLRGAEGTTPFGFSPDGEWLLVSDGSVMKKVPLAGGPAITIADDPFRVADWGPGDTIVSGSEEGLWTGSAAGGDLRQLIAPAEGETGSYYAPKFLPNGRAVLFYIWHGSPEASQVVVYDLDTGQQRILLAGTSPRFATSGHLVFFREGSLWAVPFDPDRLEVTGEPRPVMEGVGVNPLGWAYYSVAHDGTLVYRPGSGGGGVERTLVWVDREGRKEPLPAPPRPYDTPRISPDGRYVALVVQDPENTDVMVYDLERETPTRLTFDPGPDRSPLWTLDGQRVVFASARDGRMNVYAKGADGTGPVERVTTRDTDQWPSSWSADGHTLVVTDHAGAQWDVHVIALGAENRTEGLIETEFVETYPDVSPDGRWIAYMSGESGQMEVYVRPFPNVDDGRWQISRDGGFEPVWAPSGRELFFREGNTRDMMVVAVETEPTLSPGNPEVLFEAPYRTGSPRRARPWDVAQDGRFLMIKERASGEEAGASSDIVVVENWFEELNQRVPIP